MRAPSGGGKKVLAWVVLPPRTACHAGEPGAAQRPRAESSRSQAETACWLLSASRRRAARAWLALMLLGSVMRPARGNAGRFGEVAGAPVRAACRCASEASAI